MKPKVKNIFIFIIAAMVIAGGSCKQESAADDQQAPEQKGLMLTLEQMALAGFEFGTIESRLLSGDVNAPGTLRLTPGGQADISSVYEGVVAQIKVSYGDPVEKGQVLAELQQPELIGVQQKFIELNKRMAFLENDFQRQKKLYNEGVAPEKQMLQVKAEYESVKTGIEARKIVLEQSGLNVEKIRNGKIYRTIPVISPIRGMVDQIFINLGAHLQKGDPLFRIVCREQLLVALNVFEKDITKVKPGQRVNFKLSNVDSDVYEAEIMAIGGSVKEKGHTVEVLAKFDNAGELLLPGMFVAAVIHTGEKTFDALPVSAVMNFGADDAYIYFTRSNPDDSAYYFEKMPVETGYAEDGFIRVVLKDDVPGMARIVTKGGYYLKAEETQAEE